MHLSRNLIVAASAGLIMSASVSAKVKKYEDGVPRKSASKKMANQVFWRFSNCAARRDSAGAQTLLQQREWTDEFEPTVAQYSKKYGACLPDGSQMRFQAEAFRGALAAAYLVQKYRKQPAPNYLAIQTAYTNEASKALDSEQNRAVYLLRSFADCIVRNKTELSIRLFASKPSTKDEMDIFTEFQPVMGACLPVSDGEQVKFTTTSLRSLMAQAAYDLELRYVESSAANSETIN